MRYLAYGLLFFALPLALVASPVSAETASRAARAWATQRPSAHMRSRMNRTVRSVRTIQAEGNDAFHIVDFAGGGFVVMPADDRVEPVVAFSDEGTLVEDAKNPLWALLNLDIPQRVKAHRNGRVAKGNPMKRRGRGHRSRHWREPTVEWRELTEADDGLQTQKTAELASVSDVRVGALIQSKWDQGTSGSRGCYNYYTPNYYFCGCVATAGAQLMRYHKFPTSSVTAVTKSCWVDSEAMNETMKGGSYDWDNMPLVPASVSLTATQQEAIGKLCYDVGVSTRMNWTSDGSGACDAVLAESLVSVFGYANAKNELSGSMTEENMENAIYANLDAGCPVLLGIHSSDNVGHEIVADGYGLYNGTVYTHLNLGWSGSYNAWYALPAVSANGYAFTTLSSIVYNVFPDKTGELITGRVLDERDSPIVGAVVKAVNGSTTQTAVSGANGIYALHVPSGRTWSLTVTADHCEPATTNVTVGTSSSSTLAALNASTYSWYQNGSIGNSWGNDIVIVRPVYAALEHPAFVPHTQVTRTADGTTATQVASRFEDGAGNVVYSILTEKGREYALGLDGYPEGEWVTGDGTPQLLRAKKLASGTYQVLVNTVE